MKYCQRVFRQDLTTEGISLELRWDPKGPLYLPGFKDVLLAIHIGAAAKLTCRRGGRYYSGRAVHGDIDVVPAHTSMRWEAHDQNDRTLIVSDSAATPAQGRAGVGAGSEAHGNS